MNYVQPELIVVAIVLYFCGMGLKQTQAIKDKKLKKRITVSKVKTNNRPKGIILKLLQINKHKRVSLVKLLNQAMTQQLIVNFMISKLNTTNVIKVS